MHTCDVRNCVRLDHLRLGTPADNQNDMMQKVRQARGARSGGILTEDDVRLIRAEYRPRDGSSFALAYRFGVDFSLIGKVARRERWKWVA